MPHIARTLGDGQTPAEFPPLQAQSSAARGHRRLLRFRHRGGEPRHAQAAVLQPGAPLGQGGSALGSGAGSAAAHRAGRVLMEWDLIAGNWQHYKPSVRLRWGRITDEELDIIAGGRAQLAAHIQEIYGISKNAAHNELDALHGIQKGTSLA